MLTIRYQAAFKRDYKRLSRRGYDMARLERAVALLASGTPLPAEYDDHPLKGTYADCRECHLAFDWVLIYGLGDGNLTLYLMRTGTHDDVF